MRGHGETRSGRPDNRSLTNRERRWLCIHLVNADLLNALGKATPPAPVVLGQTSSQRVRTHRWCKARLRLTCRDGHVCGAGHRRPRGRRPHHDHAFSLFVLPTGAGGGPRHGRTRRRWRCRCYHLRNDGLFFNIITIAVSSSAKHRRDLAAGDFLKAAFAWRALVNCCGRR